MNSSGICPSMRVSPKQIGAPPVKFTFCLGSQLGAIMSTSFVQLLHPIHSQLFKSLNNLLALWHTACPSKGPRHRLAPRLPIRAAKFSKLTTSHDGFADWLEPDAV